LEAKAGRGAVESVSESTRGRRLGPEAEELELGNDVVFGLEGQGADGVYGGGMDREVRLRDGASTWTAALLLLL